MIEDAAAQGESSDNITDKARSRPGAMIEDAATQRANSYNIIETREKQTDVGKFVHFE